MSPRARHDPECGFSSEAESPSQDLRRMIVNSKADYLHRGIFCVAAKIVTNIVINLLALADVMV
jgi:hypothetical protein